LLVFLALAVPIGFVLRDLKKTMKRSERVSPRFGLLPAIYIPHYNLNYFKVKTEGGNIILEYHKIFKSASSDLSLLQRVMLSRKQKKMTIRISEKQLFN